ncbi:MAG: glycosyltransferase family 1 protein, partial [bacterium]|nr:glycosyltransferase family 1 protein [bacterium]
INAPLFYFKKYAITVHDLIKHYSRGPETTTHLAGFYWLKYAGYLMASWWLTRLAKKIICPSEYVKKEIEQTYPFAKGKTAVTYEAASKTFLKPKKDFSLPAAKLLKEKNLEKPFAIYVGNAYPHKNLERLVEAVKLINQKGFSLQLAIVCGRGAFYERLGNLIEKKEMAAKVKMLGFVGDEDLLMLYHEAAVYTFPSLMEGFGIPPLDAMACGLPVVSSNASCLPEIYGEAAYYFNPESVGEMTEAITRVLTDESLRKQLIKNGYERIKLYSWRKMAKETLSVYKKA